MWLGDGETSNTRTSTQSGRKKTEIETLSSRPPPTPPHAVQREAKGFTAFFVGVGVGVGWGHGNSLNIGREVLHFNFCFPLGDLERLIA